MFFDHFLRFISSYSVLLKKHVNILVQNNEMRRMSSPPSKSDQYWGYKGAKENAIQKQIRVRIRGESVKLIQFNFPKEEQIAVYYI